VFDIVRTFGCLLYQSRFWDSFEYWIFDLIFIWSSLLVLQAGQSLKRHICSLWKCIFIICISFQNIIKIWPSCFYDNNFESRRQEPLGPWQHGLAHDGFLKLSFKIILALKDIFTDISHSGCYFHHTTLLPWGWLWRSVIWSWTSNPRKSFRLNQSATEYFKCSLCICLAR